MQATNEALSARRGTLRHRLISLAAISLITILGLEALVKINNLYYPSVYNQASVYLVYSVVLYLFLVGWLYFLFDLHFKEPVINARHIFDALRQRFRYFANWNNLRHFQNFLILPGVIYWGTVIMIGINFGHLRLQQAVVAGSSLALIISYTLFKEIFHAKQTPVHNSHFIIVSYVKMYAAWLMYAASLGIVWYYCLPQSFFYAIAFFVTFALLYQACFQFSALASKTLLHIALISLLLSAAAVAVYSLWNNNYISAGFLMAGLYNFCWGMLFHGTKKSFTKEALVQQLVILALICIVVFGVTNFHARIERCLISA